MKKRYFLLLLCVIFLVFTLPSCDIRKKRAPIPAGVEINDPSVEKLFIPEFPYEWVKILDQQNGERVVAVKSKQEVSVDMFQQYYKTLERRGLSLKYDLDTKHDILRSGKVLLVREFSKKPYVIEYSEAIHKAKDITVGLPHNLAWKVGDYIVYWIEKDFGKTFKQIAIYPENNSPCPPPPLIGQYPQSRRVCCYNLKKIVGDERTKTEITNTIIFLLVSKDPPEKLFEFYRERLIGRFKAHGMGKYDWNRTFAHVDAGIEIMTKYTSFRGVDISWLEWELEHNRTRDYGYKGTCDICKYIWEDLKQEKGRPIIPDGGEVFKVEIYMGSEKWTEGFNWIKVYYETDAEKIQKIIKDYSEKDNGKPN